MNQLRDYIKFFFAVLFRKDYYYFKSFQKDLVIFDDFYPNPISGFRMHEINTYLKYFQNSKIILLHSLSEKPNSKLSISTHIAVAIEQHPFLKNKIIFQKGFINVHAKLFYFIFLNNAFSNIKVIQKFKTPFIFTLYPGGGLQLNNEISDNKIRTLMKSDYFRKVIVTQKIVFDYLLKNNFCQENQIEFIFGGVVPQQSIENFNSQKNTFLKNKATFDICFCAAKYMPLGIDKGYNVFIEAALELSKKYNFIRFHCIGGFDKNDVEVAALSNSISFYGYLNFEDLQSIFQNMDVILSPNKPFVLTKGSFDGFPLGTVIEAACNQVVVLATDYLQENTIFEDQVDFLKIEASQESIVNAVEFLIQNPSKLYEIAESGQRKFKNAFSDKVQINPRISILENQLKS